MECTSEPTRDDSTPRPKWRQWVKTANIIGIVVWNCSILVILCLIYRYSLVHEELRLESDRRSRVLHLVRLVDIAHNPAARGGLVHDTPGLLQGWRVTLSAERKERAQMLEAVVPPHQEITRCGRILLIWEVPQDRWKTDFYVAVPPPPGHPDASGAPELAMMGYTIRGQSYVRHGAVLVIGDPSLPNRPVADTVYVAPCQDEDHFRQMFFDVEKQSRSARPYSPDPRIWTHVYVYEPQKKEWSLKRR